MDQAIRGVECQYCWTFEGQHDPLCPEAAQSERMKALRIKGWWLGRRLVYREFRMGRRSLIGSFLWDTSFYLGFEKAEAELDEMEAEAIDRHRDEEEKWHDDQSEMDDMRYKDYED